jgi:hypothetical protein
VRTAGLYFGALVGGYFATTFALWFSHWFAHLRRGPLTGFHVRGHHRLYPSGAACLADSFRYGKGREDSVYSFVPWLAVLAAAIWWILPLGLAVAVTAEGMVVVGLFSYLHEQFHVSGSRLESSERFLRARALHFRHHDRRVNFAVYDHFWDFAFGTFQRGG